ncbi:MAG: quinolinate synthase NadA [Candidatus Neomarinimicrobiota bacterium]
MEKFEKGVSLFNYSSSDQKILDEIAALKNELKDDLLILGHHYQRDDVIRFADLRGDSLALSQKASETNKKHIVFCGVNFMAECADLLTSDEQKVYLPDLRAGCSMADMATIDHVEKMWKHLRTSTEDKIIPITYINSSAEIKYFVGKNDGIICTSSNASKIFDWAMERGKKILFLPDQYLGMNTALAKAIPKEKIYLLDKFPDKESIQNTEVFLWNGYCSVHKRFTLGDVLECRRNYPNIKIIVHGECRPEVAQAADSYGSTAAIIKTISEAQSGTQWAVGTEQHLVQRIINDFPDKTIIPLSGKGFQCVTMSMITPEKLLETLKEIKHEKDDHLIEVDSKIKDFSKTALIRMLSL